MASSPNPLGGTDATVTIPVISLTKSDGDSLRTQLGGGLFALIAADPLRLSGADNAGQVKLFAPSTLSGGSSVHHWDTSAFPNLLMEPNISGDLTHGVDITLDQHLHRLLKQGLTEFRIPLDAGFDEFLETAG